MIRDNERQHAPHVSERQRLRAWWIERMIPGVGLLAAYLLMRILWLFDALPRTLHWD